MNVFDTHAHYDSGAFNGDRLELLAAMPSRGVELIVNPGCDLESSRTAVELSERFPFVYAAVGVHPSDCGEWEDSWLDELRSLAARPKVKAIGEIGLDYYWKENPPREHQQQVFHKQLELAEELDLPVIVHDRDAHRDCLDIVKAHPNARGVFHCCALSAEDAKVVLDRGWMLSFTGNITFPNAKRAPEVVRCAPMDRILLETDAPYMAPVPHRGERCDSTLIPITAAAVARLKGLTVEEVLSITLENGKRLFGID